jgi:uncharacterized RDD family membrane protein YckC
MKKDKKQVVEYSSLNRRLIAAMIDIMILIPLMSPILSVLYSAIIGDNTPHTIMDQLEANHTDGSLVTTQELFEKLSETYFFAKWLSIQLIVFVIMATYAVGFWYQFSATPGKWVVGSKVVDAKTLEKPTFKQLIIRVFSYILSAIPLCIGFMMAAFTKDCSSLHDKVAGTLVINVDHNFGLIYMIRNRLSKKKK